MSFLNNSRIARNATRYEVLPPDNNFQIKLMKTYPSPVFRNLFTSELVTFCV